MGSWKGLTMPYTGGEGCRVTMRLLGGLVQGRDWVSGCQGRGQGAAVEDRGTHKWGRPLPGRTSTSVVSRQTQNSNNPFSESH